MLSRRSIQFIRGINIRLYTTSTPPALLLTLREDLKTAMRSKNKAHLSVLRTILAEITNASKTSNPANTDLSILAIINKQRSQIEGAVEEFAAAGREELVAEERERLGVLQEYAARVKTIGDEEVAAVVRSVLERMEVKGNMGEVMKSVLKELEGRPVVKGTVARIVKDAVGKK
jgi:uncharacterized protein YqeY